MKKLLFLFALSFLAIGTQAQSAPGYPHAFPVIAGDSLAGVDTVFKQIQVTAGYAALTITGNIKKNATGTLTAKMYVWTSMDGKNYVLTDSATEATTVLPSYISTLSTYTHTVSITKTTPGARYYLVGIASANPSLAASPIQVMYTTRTYTTSPL